MIAMQYSFTLPADYDMALIERRVSERGYLFDDTAALIFKAFLIARKDDATTRGNPNLYAPFYLWQDDAAMNDFLCGPRFQGVAGTFGWPAVQSWNTIATSHGSDIARARFASREILHLASYTSLVELRQEEQQLAATAVDNNAALYALSAFESKTWTLVRFRLWQQAPQVPAGDSLVYEVLHVSNPAGL